MDITVPGLLPRGHVRCVWPVGVPPVCDHLWDTHSWTRWEDKFQPEGYTGGRHDDAAWEQFMVERRAAVLDELRVDTAAQIGRRMGQEAADKWLAEARKGSVK